MKKYIVVFILLLFVAIIYLSYPFTPPKHFVYIKDNKFFLNEKEFYPVTINYIASLQTDGKEIWPCSFIGYNSDKKYRFTTKDSCLMQLKADMDLVKEMGFNSVRIVGVGEFGAEEKTGVLSKGISIGNEGGASLVLLNENAYAKYFSALQDLFQVVNEAGLKIIFLNKCEVGVESTANHLKKVITHFRNDTSIMAYDFFNEPLYFDPVERPKKDVYHVVKEWKRVMDIYAPHQLCTIGLEGIREVFEWDPNTLDVDFVSLHPYEHEPEQVRNEIYWYGKYIKKPWIIGETALPSDNDSVTYEDQKRFAQRTLKQTVDCGGAGYSWWQYKDVEWQDYQSSYLGILNWNGETKTAKKNIVVKGTVKPVAEAFKSFNPKAKKDSCLCLTNYYNYSQHSDCRITGKLIDENNDPIEGGVILGWNQWWSHSYHTVTKADGTFELMGNMQFYHWMASATEYSMVRGDIDTTKMSANKIPTLNIGKLKITRLPFAKVRG